MKLLLCMCVAVNEYYCVCNIIVLVFIDDIDRLLLCPKCDWFNYWYWLTPVWWPLLMYYCVVIVVLLLLVFCYYCWLLMWCYYCYDHCDCVVRFDEYWHCCCWPFVISVVCYIDDIVDVILLIVVYCIVIVVVITPVIFVDEWPSTIVDYWYCWWWPWLVIVPRASCLLLLCWYCWWCYWALCVNYYLFGGCCDIEWSDWYDDDIIIDWYW